MYQGKSSLSVSRSDPLPLASPPASLCILRLSAIGDVCHTLPVVRAIQRHWPATRITWIIGKLEATLLEDIPDIEFIIFDKRRGLGAYADLWRAMRGRRFDALLQMQVSLRASMASLVIPAPLRLGFDRERARDFQWLFTNARIAPRPRQHVMDGLFGFAEALGVEDLTPVWEIPVPPAAAAFAREWIPEKGRALIISPCSSNRVRNWRNWSAERYARVVDYAVERHGMKVLLTGGPTRLEQEYGKRITTLARHAPANLIGRTNLKQLFALLQRAAVLIAPDSGPVHMAVAAGTPVIGLYVTSNPDRTGPWRDRQWVVNRYPEALREMLGKEVEEVPWGKRVRSPEAMERITVEDVMERLDALMA